MRSWVKLATLFILLVSALVASHGLWGRAPEPAAEDRHIASLIAQLGDKAFAQREAASEELQTLGKRALPALREAAANHSDLEIQQRAIATIHAIVLSYSRSRSTDLHLALIQPGEFEMGSPLAESGRAVDEAQHAVRLSRPFLLGVFEVTQAQYQRVMKTNPSWFQATGEGKEKIGGQNTDELPVENVTWFDALAFCNQLSLDDGDEPYYDLSAIERQGDSILNATVTVRGGSGYRLPSEAEWEYACRAHSTTAFHFGASGGNGNLSNVKGISREGGYGGRIIGPNLQRTTRVGSYPANRFKLFDMHGNVAEWCWDWYDREYYGRSPQDDPSGPPTGDQRVARGGSWLVGELSSRAASRLMQAPGHSIYSTGFRVARSL